MANNGRLRSKLRSQLFGWFVLLAFAILAALWLLQTVFLNSFYRSMKTGEIEQLAQRLSDDYANNRTALADSLERAAFHNNVRAVIFNESSEVLYFADSFSVRDPWATHAVPRDVPELLAQLSQTGKNTVTISTTDGRDGRALLSHLRVLETGVYLYLSAALVPVESTVTVLMTQLAYVSVIALLLAVGGAYFMARRITRPVASMAAQADRFGRGEEGVVFEGGGFRELDELASALNYARQELSTLDRLRSEVVANVSHDLRTPLTIIKSYAEMVRDLSGNLPEKRAEHIGVIIDESDKLTAMVANILDLSQLRAGGPPLKRRDIDLSEVVRGVLDAFVPVTATPIERSIAPGRYVHADADRIRQVIYNLVGNAVQHGDGTSIKVRLFALPSGAGTRFEVTSGGAPIPEEKRRHIWERYYREDAGDRVGGLGLAIVSELLKAHDAAYGVDVTEAGNRFWFEMT